MTSSAIKIVYIRYYKKLFLKILRWSLGQILSWGQKFGHCFFSFFRFFKLLKIDFAVMMATNRAFILLLWLIHGISNVHNLTRKSVWYFCKCRNNIITNPWPVAQIILSSTIYLWYKLFYHEVFRWSTICFYRWFPCSNHFIIE